MLGFYYSRLSGVVTIQFEIAETTDANVSARYSMLYILFLKKDERKASIRHRKKKGNHEEEEKREEKKEYLLIVKYNARVSRGTRALICFT